MGSDVKNWNKHYLYRVSHHNLIMGYVVFIFGRIIQISFDGLNCIYAHTHFILDIYLPVALVAHRVRAIRYHVTGYGHCHIAFILSAWWKMTKNHDNQHIKCNKVDGLYNCSEVLASWRHAGRCTGGHSGYFSTPPWLRWTVFTPAVIESDSSGMSPIEQ